MRRFMLALAATALLLPTTPALAGEATWAELAPSIIGGRTTQAAGAIVELVTPYRASDDRQVPVEVRARLGDGRTVKSVIVVIDENPMPVSFTMTLDEPRADVWVAADMRFNGPSPVRAIVEASDGTLYMSEAMVKTSGLGACASPPVTGEEEALATLGDMDLTPQLLASPAGTGEARRRARLDVSHPNLTGLQIDQITLQYIPPRYVDRFAVWQGERRLFTMTAGISLSENPSVSFDFVPGGAPDLTVEIADTDATTFRRSFPLLPGS